MKILQDNQQYNFLLGDCLTVLKQVESESVDCIVTYPTEKEFIKNIMKKGLSDGIFTITPRIKSFLEGW